MASTLLDDVLTGSDSLSGKRVFFYSASDSSLESIYQNTVPVEIDQPGTELHYGIEFDLNYDSDYIFSTLAIAMLDGSRNLNYFDNNNNLNVNLGYPNQSNQQELVNNAADRLTFTIGTCFPKYNADIGFRLTAPSRKDIVHYKSS